MDKVFDALRRDGDSSNTVIGIIILIMLLVFVGPDVLPQLLAETFPIDEGVKCNFLRTGIDRGEQQSLIGRSAEDPLSLQVEVEPLRQDGQSTWVVRIIVVNNTIGTVPIVYNEDQVLVGDELTSNGIGLIFDPPLIMNLDTDRNGIPNSRPQVNLAALSVDEDDIRLLGPRQRCVHRVIFQPGQVNQMQAGITTVRAYYRVTGPGVFSEGAITNFSDQGLDILVDGITGGFIESPEVLVTLAN